MKQEVNKKIILFPIPKSFQEISKKGRLWPWIRLCAGVCLGACKRLFCRSRANIPMPTKKLKNERPLIYRYIQTLRSRGSLQLEEIYIALHLAKTPNIALSTLFLEQRDETSPRKLLAFLPAVEPHIRYVAIPLAIESLFHMRHWVLFIYDTEDNILEFYDPIGFTLADYPAAKLWSAQKGVKLTLKAFTEELLWRYGDSQTTLIQNNRLHQRDTVNCAFFLIKRFKDRCVRSLCFNSTQKEAPSSKEAFSCLREELYYDLKKNNLSN